MSNPAAVVPPVVKSLEGRIMKGLPRRGRAVSGPPGLSQTRPLTVRMSDVEMKDGTNPGISVRFTGVGYMANCAKRSRLKGPL